MMTFYSILGMLESLLCYSVMPTTNSRKNMFLQCKSFTLYPSVILSLSLSLSLSLLDYVQGMFVAEEKQINIQAILVNEYHATIMFMEA